MATNKSVAVLGVPHQIQGVGFPNYIHDQPYSRLVADFAAEVDFVFEEAAGCGPSIAEDVAASVLGLGHYLNVDPPRSERPKNGLAMDTGGVEAIDTDQIVNGLVPDIYRWEIVDEHRKREQFWVQRIVAQSFNKGLLICGSAHGLSVAFRLQDAGISVPTLYDRTPYDKLCRRLHSD
jgi:hypothetical protein